MAAKPGDKKGLVMIDHIIDILGGVIVGCLLTTFWANNMLRAMSREHSAALLKSNLQNYDIGWQAGRTANPYWTKAQILARKGPSDPP